VIFVMMKVYFM